MAELPRGCVRMFRLSSALRSRAGVRRRGAMQNGTDTVFSVAFVIFYNAVFVTFWRRVRSSQPFTAASRIFSSVRRACFQ